MPKQTPGVRTHELKCWPQFFDAILDGSKPYEVRKDDRDFAVGDTLHLREWNPDTWVYTGRETRARITHKLTDNAFGVALGYCVLGLNHRAPKGVHPLLRECVEQVIQELREEAEEDESEGLRKSASYLRNKAKELTAALGAQEG